MSIAINPYSEYKDSGLPWLGDIPKHWIISPGFTVFKQKQHKNTGMIETTVLSLSYGRIVVKPADKLHGLVPTSFETYQVVDPGEIIIRPTDLQNDWTSLRVGISRNHGIITSAYICLKTTDLLIPDYGYLLLHTYDLMKIFYGMGSGLRQNLNYTDLKRMPVFVPPKKEQTAIVRFVETFDHQIDRLIHTKRRLVDLLNEQKQAIIHRAVTRGLDTNVCLKPSGIECLGDVPEHWEVVLNQRIFKEEIRSHNGLSETQLSLSQRDGLIATSDMKERSMQTSTYDNWKVTIPGDLVLNRFKAHLGVFFSSNLRGIVSFHYGVFTPRVDLVTKYFELLFHTNPYRTIYAGRSNGMTVGLQNLSNQNFYNVRSVVPPVNEQAAIVSFVDKATERLNTVIATTKCEIELLREYRIRLISDVVTGKLDARDVELSDINETEVMEYMDTCEDTESEELIEN